VQRNNIEPCTRLLAIWINLIFAVIHFFFFTNFALKRSSKVVRLRFLSILTFLFIYSATFVFSNINKRQVQLFLVIRKRSVQLYWLCITETANMNSQTNSKFRSLRRTKVIQPTYKEGRLYFNITRLFIGKGEEKKVFYLYISLTRRVGNML